MDDSARYYSQKAQEMRELATKAVTRVVRDEFLKLALEYDDLASLAHEDRSTQQTA